MGRLLSGILLKYAEHINEVRKMRISALLVSNFALTSASGLFNRLWSSRVKWLVISQRCFSKWRIWLLYLYDCYLMDWSVYPIKSIEVSLSSFNISVLFRLVMKMDLMMFVLYYQMYLGHFASKFRMNWGIILLKHSKWVTILTHCVIVWVTAVSTMDRKCVIFIPCLLRVQIAQLLTNQSSKV